MFFAILSKIALVSLSLVYPWTPEAIPTVLSVETKPDNLCEWAGFYNPSEPDCIYVCDRLGRLGMEHVTLHELIHLLTYEYDMVETADWNAFVVLTLLELEQGDCEDWRMERAIDALNPTHDWIDGRRELHAKALFLFDGELPRSLYPWYPWFDFGER
jgi:hypothetical protein